MVTLLLGIALCVTLYSALPYLLAIVLVVVAGKTIWRALKHDDKEES